jgi:hypothetical protein
MTLVMVLQGIGERRQEGSGDRGCRPGGNGSEVSDD